MKSETERWRWKWERGVPSLQCFSYPRLRHSYITTPQLPLALQVMEFGAILGLFLFILYVPPGATRTCSLPYPRSRLRPFSFVAVAFCPCQPFLPAYPRPEPRDGWKHFYIGLQLHTRTSQSTTRRKGIIGPRRPSVYNRDIAFVTPPPRRPRRFHPANLNETDAIKHSTKCISRPYTPSANWVCLMLAPA